MVHDLVRGPAGTEPGVLVAKRVERVRVAGEDSLELAARQRGDVIRREAPEQPLLAGAADVVPGGSLPVVDAAHVHPGLPQQGGQRPGVALVTGFHAGVVAEIPELLDGRLAGVRQFGLEPLGPSGPLALVLAEAVSA